MSNRVEVHTQAEFDACIEAGNVAIVVAGRIVLRDHASAELRDHASAELRDHASAVLWDRASAVLRDHASAELWDHASAELRDRASAVLRNRASAKLWDHASAELRDHASAVLCGNASAVLRDRASAVLWENASAVLLDNASAVLWENASAVLWENASAVLLENASAVLRENASAELRGGCKIKAFGNVFLRLFSALSVHASASVVIMVHGEAEILEGGRQIKAAPLPVTGAEWCEYWGLDPAAVPYAVPGIDAKILAAVERHKTTSGLDMASWHGAKCDETNWCKTTHCRAGYAICLAGKPGFDLERKYGPEIAGKMIYAVSRPEMALPDFHASTADAMADIKRCAAATPHPKEQ